MCFNWEFVNYIHSLLVEGLSTSDARVKGEWHLTSVCQYRYYSTGIGNEYLWVEMLVVKNLPHNFLNNYVLGHVQN